MPHKQSAAGSSSSSGSAEAEMECSFCRENGNIDQMWHPIKKDKKDTHLHPWCFVMLAAVSPLLSSLYQPYIMETKL